MASSECCLRAPMPDLSQKSDTGQPASEQQPEPCFDVDDGLKITQIREAEGIKYNWKDITKEFTSASSQLRLGELLHDANFGLFEAMSAIEMMDPKMDAGMMCNQTGRQVMGLEQSIQMRGLKIKGLSPEELIGVLDNTMACIATWLEGHSLAQTVFTNLYTHNPDLIADRCIRAFTLAVLKIVEIVKDKVVRASVFEEEDFQSMTYGFKLAHSLTDLRVIGMLREVEEEFNRRIKSTRSRHGEERNAAMELEHELCLAVQCRMKFVRMFYSGLMATNKKEVKPGVEDARKLLKEAADLLPTIQRSIHLGIKPKSCQTNGDGKDQVPDFPVIMGFEPLVNQRLLPPTFPRYSPIMDCSAAVKYFDGLVTRLRRVCEVTNLSSFHAILDFIGDFSKQCPCVLSRSTLQLLFLPFNNKKVFGLELVQESLRDGIRAFVCPPALVPKSPIYNNPQVKEIVDSLLLHAVRPMCTLVQIQGHNRARQRDKLGQVLEELANLQDEAEKVDAGVVSFMTKCDPKWPYQACFGSWVMYHILRTMLRYVLSGFELELYASHEYHYIYWYLADFLYAWFISTVTRADSMLQDNEAAFVEPNLKNRNKKKNKRRKSRPFERELGMAQAYQLLCSAYYKAVVGFTMDGRLKRPNCMFDSEKVRFEHRFAAFSVVLTPPLVQYETFCEMTDIHKMDASRTPLDLYYTSCKLFMQSSAMLEKIPHPSQEMNALIRVAKTNVVVIKLLLGGHKRHSVVPPEFNFSVHKVFPIIKLK